LIAIGFLFANWKKLALAPVAEIIVYLTTPCLVFTSLVTRRIVITDVLVMLIGIVAILGGVGIFIRLYFLVFRFRSRGFTLPALFMNAGNIGIPLALFALGEPGLQRATLLFVIVSFIHNTLGIYILQSTAAGWKEVFRLPLIYATVLGLFFSITEIPLPDPIFEPLRMLGHASIPLMLITLGYRLHGMGTLHWGHSLGGAFVRIFGGLAAGYAVVDILRIEGINRQVLLLYSALPAAVVNFVLTEKYHQDPELAASIIIVSTVFSVFTIPVVLWLIL
jgi:hypothetical protein